MVVKHGAMTAIMMMMMIYNLLLKGISKVSTESNFIIMLKLVSRNVDEIEFDILTVKIAIIFEVFICIHITFYLHKFK